MKQILKSLFITTILLCSGMALFAQEENYIQGKNYVQQGDESFTRGEYERAAKFYNLAKEIDNVNIGDKLKTAESCKAFLAQGDDFYFNENYDKARMCYQFILDVNPVDENVKKRFVACEKMLKARAQENQKRREESNRLIEEQSKEFVEIKTLGVAVIKSDVGTYGTWATANDLCQNLIIGGFTDWRLPTKEELISIYSQRNNLNIFNLPVYGSVPKYWTDKKDKTGGYFVDFEDGSYRSYNDRSKLKCRCVRTLPKDKTQ